MTEKTIDDSMTPREAAEVVDRAYLTAVEPRTEFERAVEVLVDHARATSGEPAPEGASAQCVCPSSGPCLGESVPHGGPVTCHPCARQDPEADCLAPPDEGRRLVDGRPDAGPWQHDDGTPCPVFLAPRPAPRSGGRWWCTEHQSHLSPAPSVATPPQEGDAASIVRSALAEAHEESPGSDYDLDVAVEWVLERAAALRDATPAPAVEVTWTSGPWLMPGECLDDECAARSVSHRHSVPVGPSRVERMSAPLAVGDTVTTAEELESLPIWTAMRTAPDRGGLLVEKVRPGAGPWRAAGQMIGVEVPDLLGARVLDLSATEDGGA